MLCYGMLWGLNKIAPNTKQFHTIRIKMIRNKTFQLICIVNIYFFKEKHIYGRVKIILYAMLWYMYFIVWYEDWDYMLWFEIPVLCFEIPMLCYEMSMLCYALVYVVKDMLHLTAVCSNIFLPVLIYNGTVFKKITTLKHEISLTADCSDILLHAMQCKCRQ